MKTARILVLPFLWVLSCAAPGTQSAALQAQQTQPLRLEVVCEDCAAGQVDSARVRLIRDYPAYGFRQDTARAEQLRVFLNQEGQDWLLNWVLNDQSGTMIELSRLRVTGDFDHALKEGGADILNQTQKTLSARRPKL